MIVIIVLLAFILSWFFIEITLFIANKNYFNLNQSENKISYNKFIWNLRILALLLFLFTLIYMYNYQNDKLLKAIEYCLGVIR